jgi:hypothetical protein
MDHTTHNPSFAAVLVIALAGTPALGLAQVPSPHGALRPPPLVHFATLPRRTRLRKRSRNSRVRRSPPRSRGFLRGAAAAIGARRKNLRRRLLLGDSYARGPPV